MNCRYEIAKTKFGTTLITIAHQDINKHHTHYIDIKGGGPWEHNSMEA